MRKYMSIGEEKEIEKEAEMLDQHRYPFPRFLSRLCVFVYIRYTRYRKNERWWLHAVTWLYAPPKFEKINIGSSGKKVNRANYSPIERVEAHVLLVRSFPRLSIASWICIRICFIHICMNKNTELLNFHRITPLDILIPRWCSLYFVNDARIKKEK